MLHRPTPLNHTRSLTPIYRAREKFAWARSDILLNLKAYNAASQVKGAAAVRSFCEENFISWTTLRDIGSLRQDFINALAELGYLNPKNMDELNINSGNENLLKAIFTGGMYPHVSRFGIERGLGFSLNCGACSR